MFSVALLIASLALTSAAPIQSFTPVSSTKARFVSIPLTRIPPPLPESPLSFAAGSSFNVQMLNSIMAYNVEIAVGGQNITVQLDTGSADLWVYSTSSIYCENEPTLCSGYGAYNSSASKNSVSTGQKFHIQYGIGEVDGVYYKDTASLGSASVSDFQFGVSVSDAASGEISVFGIGPVSDEAAHHPYANFPVALKNQGVVERNLYALSFGLPGDSQQSEITFGAYNKGRYTGDLHTVPVVTPNHFGITVDSATVGDSTILKGETLILDSGTSLSYLTTPNYNAVMSQIQSLDIPVTSAGQGISAIPCADVGLLSMNYSFGNKTITVSGEDMTIPGIYLDQRDTSGLCILGITESTGSMSNMNLMGDTFLRAIYTVYDLEKKTVSLAQAAHGKPDDYVTVGAVNSTSFNSSSTSFNSSSTSYNSSSTFLF